MIDHRAIIAVLTQRLGCMAVVEEDELREAVKLGLMIAPEGKGLRVSVRPAKAEDAPCVTPKHCGGEKK